MTNIVRFPHGRRIPAATIPRAEFERLAELALDVVDQIVALLSEPDDGCDAREADTPYTALAVDLSQQPKAAGSTNNQEGR